MKTLFVLAFLASIISFNACDSSKKTTKDNSTSNSNTTVVKDDNTYRLVVDFYSIGAGIDGAALDKFQGLLDGRSRKLTYDKMRWGREGECDYCLRLNELGKKEQEDFVSEVKKLLASSQLVHIEENKTCKGTKIN